MELYVGNLPWATTDADLTTLFTQYGQVQRAKVVSDRETGRSRGFAFVTMADAAQGQAAIKGLNGSQQSGRAITVRLSEPRPAGAGGAGGGGGGGDRGDRGGDRGDRGPRRNGPPRGDMR